MDYTTTNIRIEMMKLKELKRRALERNQSLASLIREILDEFLGMSKSETSRLGLAARQKRAVRQWAATSLGKGFAGREHDGVLYGEES